MSRRDRAKTYLRVFVGVSILGFLIWKAGPRDIAQQFAAADLVYVVATLAIMLLDVPIRSWNWQHLIGLVGTRAPLSKLSYAYLTGGFWGCVLPSSVGTDVARATMAARSIPMAFSTALATVVSLNALGLLASTMVGIVGAAWLYADGVQARIAALIGLLFCGQLVILFALLWLVGHARSWLMSSIPSAGQSFVLRLHHFARKLGTAFQPLGNSGTTRRRLLAVAIVSQVLRPVGLLTACLALYTHVPFAALVMWLPLGVLVSLLPISIAGFGGKQVVHVAYLILFGIPPQIGLAISLLYQATQLVADLVGGVAFVVSGEPRLLRPTEDARDPVAGPPKELSKDGTH